MSKGEESVLDREPSEEEMVRFLGKQAGKMWKKIVQYMRENYDFEPVREKGSLEATIRYRKSGKTLLTFYPKRNEITVLIILGKDEVQKFESSRGEFSPGIVELFRSTKQYHDGRWLHIKIPPFDNLEDIKKLLLMKRKPKKSS